MVFSSITFLLYFLPIFLVVYIALPKMLKNYWILLASCVFYAWGAPLFLLVVLASTIIDFYLVRWMHQAVLLKRKRSILFLSIGLNVGLLAFFKYANFFIENMNSAFASIGVSEVGWTEIALPIGISFYTFQTLTYSIDVYRGTNKPLDGLHTYLLYILSFPQLIAGPIVRFGLVAEQLVNRPDTIDDKLYGFYRFCIGLAKKVLIANVLGRQADFFLELPAAELSTTAAWLGMLCFTFQIYFDFAGYSDMAIGLGRMMGFTFPENFNNPYNASSISEFWQRWHITLGQWMRDYLYIPLGGNRVKNSRLYTNLLIVFVISGLWHGDSWNFVLWGLFHGTFLVLDRLFLEKLLLRMGKIPSVLITFFIVVIGWTIFSIEDDVTHVYAFLGRMFAFDFSGISSVISSETIAILALAVFISFSCTARFGKLLQSFIYSDNLTARRSVGITVVSALLFIVCAGYVSASDFNPFIYFRF